MSVLVIVKETWLDMIVQVSAYTSTLLVHFYTPTPQSDRKCTCDCKGNMARSLPTLPRTRIPTQMMDNLDKVCLCPILSEIVRTACDILSQNPLFKV